MGFLDEISLIMIFDRQKGLIATIDQHFPDATIRFCARHVYAKFRKKFFVETLREKFWKAARAINSINFDIFIEALMKMKLRTNG